MSETTLAPALTVPALTSPDTYTDSLAAFVTASPSSYHAAAEVAARVELAGLEVVEVRISSLAYAPEIAQAMLQRQQAGAVIAAREQIVEGAVTMVDQALRRLEEGDIVAMDDERRAQMVSNLLVVLCSDQRTQPVVNTGSLYA